MKNFQSSSPDDHHGMPMEEHPYSTSNGDELIVRDYLATDRTTLANERTLLAYIRTAIALCLGGISLIKFVNIMLIQLFGWFLIPIGIGTFATGVIKYIKMEKILAKVPEDEEENVEETESSENQPNNS